VGKRIIIKACPELGQAFSNSALALLLFSHREKLLKAARNEVQIAIK
jgi:hypothetical protein